MILVRWDWHRVNVHLQKLNRFVGIIDISFQQISVLLKLSETIHLGKFINTICLPLQNQFTYFYDDNIRKNLIQDRKFAQKM